MEPFITLTIRKRIPIYYKTFLFLKEQGWTSTTSQQLGLLLQIDARTIRKDFSKLGSFGNKGKGYNVSKMIEIFESEFKLKDLEPITLIGLGHLGKAILQYYAKQESVSEISQIYEVDYHLVNTKYNGINILDYEMIEKTKDEKSHIAILAIPARGAQEVFEKLVKLGFNGFINFTGTKIYCEDTNIFISDIDLMQEIQSLIYDLRVKY